MNKSNDKRARKRLICLIVLLVLVSMLALISWLVRQEADGAAQKRLEELTENENNPELQIEQVGDEMVLQTAYCELRYPYAFSDVIQVEQVDSNNTFILDFMFVFQDIRTPIFSLCFGNDGDDLIGSITTAAGDSVSVQLIAYDMPEQLSEKEDARNTYYAAREVMNDILNSLMGSPAFISEDSN